MATGEPKSKVDSTWNTVCARGIANPLRTIEQLTYRPFTKRTGEMSTLPERNAARAGKSIEEAIFAAGQPRLPWSWFKGFASEEIYATVRDEGFSSIVDASAPRTTARHRFRLLAALATCFAAACTSTGAFPDPPSPAAIPALEQQFAGDSSDVAIGTELALAYNSADRVNEAAALASQLRDQNPEDPAVLLAGALVAEKRERYNEAAGLYQAALDREPVEVIRQAIRPRLAAVRSNALRDEVRAAIQQEADLNVETLEEGAVGIMPFAFEGTDSTWAPLSLALTDMLTTDLALTDRLRVLERARVGTLLDELEFSESGRMEAATAARGGRILGVGKMVQGVLRIEGDSRVGVEASVVETRVSESDLRFAPVRLEDQVERLFALEKALAFRVYEDLGIQLTIAERERISEYQTESLPALLAFGEGLEAQDQGNFARAAERFDTAAELDPDFANAASKSAEVKLQSQIAGSVTLTQAPFFSTRFRSRREAVRALSAAPTSVRRRVLRRLGPEKRASLIESLGLDRVGQVLLLQLTFRPPGGE